MGGGGEGGGAWARVSDELLRAVNHALSNRLAALISLSRVLDQSSVAGDPLLAVLQEEVERLEGTTRLLRLLPREEGEQPEPVRFADVLDGVIALHRLQSDTRDLDVEVEGEDGGMPLWVEPTLLTRALLLVLQATTAAAAASGAAVHIGVTGDDMRAGLRVTAPAGADEEGAAADALAAAAAMLAGAGGELRREESGEGADREVRVELWLPTLLAVRRAERGGAAG